MAAESYSKLRMHLDRLPDGFPPSPTGADLRLLRRLFTPEEAELATHLTLDREPTEVIAERAGLSLAKAQPMLIEMARKGLIFSIDPEDGLTLYQAVPFAVGIIEFQINNLTQGLVEDLTDYISTRVAGTLAPAIPQVRTIPVGESLDRRLEALPYERIAELIDAQDRFAVAPCICRRKAKMLGQGCNAPEETCMMLGDWADYYVRWGRGRRIERAEAMEILARADAANLVLQPSNSQEIAFLCCCCSCCCDVLAGLKLVDKE